MNKFLNSLIGWLVGITLVVVGWLGNFTITGGQFSQFITLPSAYAAETSSLIAQVEGSAMKAEPSSGTYEKTEPSSGTYEGYLGYLPDDYYEDLGGLTEAEKRGLQTWYFWTGFGEDFFRTIAKSSHGEIDLLRLIDARPDEKRVPGDDQHHVQRNERFKTLGVVNDPGCKAATKPDQYGFWLDQCAKDSHATGIMGVRKFENANFDPEKWDVAAYYQGGSEVEPPYNVGISCGICHIAFDPLNPPDDPESPAWSNIASALGNQYIVEPGLFGSSIPDDDFRKQVLNHQPPGTSDTSRVATDHINNPNVINAIFNLEDRLTVAEEEVMNDGSIQAVPHVLKDGADSVGVALASLRVYVNIGMCSEQWLQRHDAVEGRTAQSPFDIEQARKECKGWQQTEPRMADAEKFLATIGPMHLEDAPGGKAFLTKDEKVLERGKIAFADTCASCHSSKRPPGGVSDTKTWFRESVLSPDFRDHNFLSNDKRYPVTMIKTNAARALATNATAGHIWGQFSSQTYKDLPSPGTLTLENPFNADKPIEFEVPDGGVGYYRTPSLISIWTSAPFLHNNSVGKYIPDPSVAARMEAFDDAIAKMLWPEKRDHIIHRTDRETHLTLGRLETDVPKGTPINLLANLDPRTSPAIVRSKLNSAFGAKVLARIIDIIPDRKLAALLVKNNQIPDFVVDHGHTFGSELPDEDKQALIEFLKTL